MQYAVASRELLETENQIDCLLLQVRYRYLWTVVVVRRVTQCTTISAAEKLHKPNQQ